MLTTSIDDRRIGIGPRFAVSFQRTLRIPDDGREYPLPPGLGAFPIYKAADFPDTPEKWREDDDVFIPMYQREALWINFDAAEWKPNAVQVGVGNVNAVSGEAWKESLVSKPQNYLVCPTQPWLDGINVGNGQIRQFVAMPVGSGLTVESQIGSGEEAGGIRIAAYEPVPGKFPDEPPPRPKRTMQFAMAVSSPMGLGAGGTMRQKIYPDPHGIGTWDAENRGSVFVHIVDSETFRELTGKEPPPSPIEAKTYTEYGFPWFDLYDEHRATIEATEKLSKVQSISSLDSKQAGPQDSLEVPPGQVKKLNPKG